MNCEEARKFLNGYVDGELDLAKSLEIERHLQSCAGCLTEFENLRALRSALRGASLSFAAPAGLEKRVMAAVRQEAEPNTKFLTRRPWLSAAAAVILLCMILSAGVLMRGLRAPDAGNLLAQEVIASHVRSLMAAHLTDVTSTNQHTVKPWFAGKLDFSPPVKDLAPQGFPLIGGRLDYVDHRPVAALIYKRQKHYINLFVWPEQEGTDGGLADTTSQGYNVVHWDQADMSCWAVSDLNTAELREFAEDVRK